MDFSMKLTEEDIHPYWRQLQNQLYDLVKNRVNNQVSDQLWDQAWNRVSDRVAEQVWDQVWSRALDHL